MRKNTQIFEEIPNFFIPEIVNFAVTERSLKGCHCISGDWVNYFLGKSTENFEEKSKGFWGWALVSGYTAGLHSVYHWVPGRRLPNATGKPKTGY